MTLGGLLARHRGVFAVLVAGGLPAVFPDSIQAAHTVLVEPWLALFCLAGALAVFEGDRLTACHRRLVWGGVAFGFAGAVEVWAIFPLVVIAALSLRAPRRLARYLAGAAAGFLVPVLPLAIIAPRGLYQGLVVAQVGGRYHPRRVPNWYRVKEMVGLSDFHVTHATPQFVVAGVIAAFVVAVLGLACWVTRRPPTALEWFVIASAILVAAAFMWPSQFHYHFPAFLVPFLALAIALPSARLIGGARGVGGGGFGPGRGSAVGRGRPGPGRGSAVGRGRPGPGRGSAVGRGRPGPAVGGPGLGAVDRDRAGGAGDRRHGHCAGAVRDGPRAACGLFNGGQSTAAYPPQGPAWSLIKCFVLLSRTVSSPTCLAARCWSNSVGTDYALSHGRNPLTGAAQFRAAAAIWRSAMNRAQYVWLSGRRVAPSSLGARAHEVLPPSIPCGSWARAPLAVASTAGMDLHHTDLRIFSFELTTSGFRTVFDRA